MASRYALAAAVTAAAFLAGLALDLLAQVHTNLPLVTAVAISAWYGGRGPGLLASLLSLAVLLSPFGRTIPGAFYAPGVGEAVHVATFLVVAFIIGATTESLRLERAQAHAQAVQLEDVNLELEQRIEEVQTLSGDLKQSNVSLARALALAEGVARRARRLQEVTAALAKARTEDDVAEVTLGEGLSALGAARGFLARVEGDQVQIFRTAGYSSGTDGPVLASPAKLPEISRSARSGEAVWVRSSQEHRGVYGEAEVLFRDLETPYTSAAIPLLHGDEVVGILGLVFLDGSSVNAATEAFSPLLGQAAAGALVRARSFDAEHAARESAELLAKARADVLAIVAHDLRNPLNLVSSSTSLLLDVEDLPAERRRMLTEVAQRSVGQMNRLVSDLLDAARLQVGRLTLELHDVDAGRFVREAGETLRPAAEKKRVELLAEAPEHECWIRADEGRLFQVVANLVANALKFANAGGRVVLSARRVAVEVVFSVADDGPGIPPEHQSRLFDGFWQGRRGDRRGVGLGLTISKGIVEAHGGRIWLENTGPAGSTFLFSVPARMSVLGGQGGQGPGTAAA